MRKLLAFIFITLFVPLSVFFFVLLNLRVSVNSPSSLKDAAQRSGVYDVAAAYIKGKVVQENNINLDQGNTFEKLNEEITGDFSKKIVDEAIDRSFEVLKGKDKNSSYFLVSFENSDLGYSFNKSVQIKDNIFVVLYQKIWLVVLILGLAGAISLILAILCLKDLTARLSWIGSGLVCLSILLFLLFIFIKNFEPQSIENLIKQTSFFVDPKLINGFVKYILAVFTGQSLLYYGESAVLFFLGCFLLFSSGALKREVIDKIDAMFFNEKPKEIKVDKE